MMSVSKVLEFELLLFKRFKAALWAEEGRGDGMELVCQITWKLELALRGLSIQTLTEQIRWKCRNLIFLAKNVDSAAQKKKKSPPEKHFTLKCSHLRSASLLLWSAAKSSHVILHLAQSQLWKPREQSRFRLP